MTEQELVAVLGADADRFRKWASGAVKDQELAGMVKLHEERRQAEAKKADE